MLEQLAPREREVLALASRAGLAVSEIAARSGLSETDVHQLLRRSLQTFRTELDRTLRREAP